MKSKKILIIDDEEKNIKLMQALLGVKGYQTYGETNSKNTFKRVKDILPDLILLDVMMPGIDGIEICRRLKQRQDTRIIPVVIITALKDHEVKIRAIAAGADEILRKPVDKSELFLRIKSLLQIKAYHEKLIKSNKKLASKEEELRKHQEYLEETVTERTRELKNINKELRREITKHKHTVEKLRESEEKFKSITESAQDAVIMIDHEANISYWNAAAETIFGYETEEILGKKLHMLLMPERYHNAYSKAFLEFRETGTGTVVGKTVEHVALRKDGAEFPIELSLSAVCLKGKWNAIGMIRDISKRKQLEAQLFQAHKMEAVGTLAGGVAHDFNNLLMGIQGNTSLMLIDMERSNPFHGRLMNIEKCVKDGAALINQLLGFARAGKYEVKTTDLNQLIETSIEMFGRTNRKINIQKHYEKDISPVEVDQIQIEQVLLNLYINAGQAMPEGGTLSIATENVIIPEKNAVVCSLSPGRYVQVSVADTGIGMDSEILGKIFDPFFTTKEIGQGTGLGLTLAYGIANGHGGSIAVSSKEGMGTRFNLYLPVSGGEVEKLTYSGNDIMTGSETILFIDDEDLVIDIGRELLQRLGYRVITAQGGREAIDTYSAQYQDIDMVIMDMIMPEMSGDETFDRLMAIEPCAQILLSSGYGIDGKASQIIERGCRGFIQKPFDIYALSKKIRDVLDHAV